MGGWAGWLGGCPRERGGVYPLSRGGCGPPGGTACCSPPPAGSHRPLGLEGWRFAFLSLAAVSGAAGVANLLLTEDPLYERRRRRQRQQAPAAAADALAAVVVDGEAAAAGGEAGPDAIAAGRAAAEEAELEAVERRSPSSDRSGVGGRPAGWDGGGSPGGQPGAGSSRDGPDPRPRPSKAGSPSAPAWRQQRGGWLRTPLRSAQGLLAAARPVAREVASVLRIPTFRIIVLQVSSGTAGPAVVQLRFSCCLAPLRCHLPVAGMRQAAPHWTVQRCSAPLLPFPPPPPRPCPLLSSQHFLSFLPRRLSSCRASWDPSPGPHSSSSPSTSSSWA